MDFTIHDEFYKEGNKQICKVSYKGTLMCAKIYDFYPVSRQFYPLQEYKILSGLANFENSLKVFGSNEYVDSLTKMKKFAIFMEFCSNGNLDQYLAKRKKKNLYFKEIEIWSHLKKFTVLLRYLQRKSISHRDIKPGNILVTEDEKLKLSDFGDAKEDECGKTHTLRGTYLYLSPKLLEAFSMNVTSGRRDCEHNLYKSDVYSLGLVILSMVSLEGFENIEDRDAQIIKKKELLNSIILRQVLDFMMETEEERRYDFEDLGRAIEIVSQGQICWGCGDYIYGYKCECLNCSVTFHQDCTQVRNSYVCGACQQPIKEVEIEFLDASEEFEINRSVLNYCLFCSGQLIESNGRMICNKCQQEACSICRAVDSGHSKCIRQYGFHFDCICGHDCFYDSSLLFFDCPECGVICRVCFEQDVSRSHLSCARMLNIKLN